MSRMARLLSLSLGALLACDGTAPTAIGPDDPALDVQVATLVVDIDIQPLGVPSDILNLHAMSGQLRVAVLSAVTSLDDGTIEVVFDPAGIDYATVTFLGASEIHVEPADPGPNCQFPATFPAGHYTDVDADGVADALFHFAVADLVLPSDLENGAEVYACVTGQLLDEDPADQLPPATFQGCADAVVRF